MRARPREDGDVTNQTLAGAIRARIDDGYEGNQAAFARATGLGPAYVNHLIKGKVSIPSPEYRDVLARELGVRRIDLLVLSGAVTPDEASEIAAPGEAISPEERRLLRAWRAATPASRRSLLLVAEEMATLSGGG